MTYNKKVRAVLKIGKVYLERLEGQTRLCADVSMNGRGTTLWFGVVPEQEEYLCVERSDAFVMALLPTAMREGQDISCETPMSQRLHYQLEHYLVPTLADAGTLYHRISIHAPLTNERVQNKGGVGTGFSGGVDSLYTIMTHGADSDYPLTHLTHFNVGVFEGTELRENFRKSCANAQAFADEMGFELVGLDSNLPEALPERFLDVFNIRNLSGALALQGLFSVYLLSSGFDFGYFQLDLHHCARFDSLTVHCAQTENMAVYLSGASRKRVEKLAALAQWPPAHQWLHPCIYGNAGEKNCGHCKKCTRDLVAIYAQGKLECFNQVFDVPAFYKSLPQRIGFLLANGEDYFSVDPIRLLQEKNVPIPPAAYIFEKQFRIAMQNLKEKQI